jgi:thioesterase domain-containing protein
MGAGTVLGVYGQIAAGEANKKINEYNAKVLDAQATDAVARGEEQVGLIEIDARRTVGAQRTSLAGQGIDLSSETAQAIQADTAVQAAKDIRTTKANALREAWGYRSQAQGARMAGKYAYQGAMLNSAGSLLTGTAQTAGAYQDYRSRGKGN